MHCARSLDFHVLWLLPTKIRSWGEEEEWAVTREIPVTSKQWLPPPYSHSQGRGEKKKRSKFGVKIRAWVTCLHLQMYATWCDMIPKVRITNIFSFFVSWPLVTAFDLIGTSKREKGGVKRERIGDCRCMVDTTSTAVPFIGGLGLASTLLWP